MRSTFGTDKLNQTALEALATTRHLQQSIDVLYGKFDDLPMATRRMEAQLEELVAKANRTIADTENKRDRFITVNPPEGQPYQLSLGGEGTDEYHDNVAHGYNQDTVWHLLNSWVRKGDVFFDLGANIGGMSIGAAVRGASVHCFEMLAANVAHLARSIDRNQLTDIRIIHGALGSSSDVVGIAGRSAWGERFLSAGEPMILMPGVVIDDYVDRRNIARVDVMKIDIEGSELDALTGARRLLVRDAPDIIIEANTLTCGKNNYSYRDLLRFLEELGYTIYRLHKGELCAWNNKEMTQECIVVDYFVTKQSPEEVVRRSKLNMQPEMPREWIIESVLKQALETQFHRDQVVMMQDRLPPEVKADPRVREVLSAWERVAIPDYLELLGVGSA